MGFIVQHSIALNSTDNTVQEGFIVYDNNTLNNIDNTVYVGFICSTVLL